MAKFSLKDDLIRRAKRQKYISEAVIFKLGGLSYANDVLLKHGLKLVYGYSHPDKGSYFKIERTNQMQINLTPCFQRIKSCGHLRDCYLAPKCPAALNHARKYGITLKQ